MKPDGVYQVLKGIGATHLHHANTVTTSCTFLEHAALLSRDYVEKHGLAQTNQSSDEIDKKYGIWTAYLLTTWTFIIVVDASKDQTNTALFSLFSAWMFF